MRKRDSIYPLLGGLMMLLTDKERLFARIGRSDIESRVESAFGQDRMLDLDWADTADHAILIGRDEDSFYIVASFSKREISESSDKELSELINTRIAGAVRAKNVMRARRDVPLCL